MTFRELAGHEPAANHLQRGLRSWQRSLASPGCWGVTAMARVSPSGFRARGCGDEAALGTAVPRASRLLGWDVSFCLASQPWFTHPRGFWPQLRDPAPLRELRNLGSSYQPPGTGSQGADASDRDALTRL